MPRRFEALFYPHTVCLRQDVLKYLVLIYDKVHFLPMDAEVHGGGTTIRDRWSPYDSMLLAAFGTREEAHHGVMFGGHSEGWDEPLTRLMDDYDQLESEGVCVPHFDERIESASGPHPLHGAVQSDVADAKFVELCEVHRNEKYFVPAQPTNVEAKFSGLTMRPPRYKGGDFFTSICSERINTALLLADAHGLAPVSPHRLFVDLLANKLDRARHEPAVAERYHDEPAARARFGLLSWKVATEVVPPELLTRRGVSDILKYRNASQDECRRFHEYLERLEAGLVENLCSPEAHQEMERLVVKEVLPELERVRAAKARLWEKLFGDVALDTFSAESVAKMIAVPALGVQALGMSYWEVLCYATAMVLRKGVLANLVEARRQERDLRRNGLHFLLEL